MKFKILWIIVIVLILVYCFVPIIEMPYEVVAMKEVEEEYIALEPYTETVREKIPYVYNETVVEKVPRIPTDKDLAEMLAGTFSGSLYDTKIKTVPVTRYSTVTSNVTKYREVTKTRLVERPVVETRTKRVSALRYLLR